MGVEPNIYIWMHNHVLQSEYIGSLPTEQDLFQGYPRLYSKEAF